jgi:hypothetical protein
MKFTHFFTVAIVGLSGCATNQSTSTVAAQSGEAVEAIRAFEAVCIKTAPSFSGAAQAAKNFGITEITDAGFMKMGMNKDQSLGVQIKEENECAITTPSQNNGTLTKQFLQVVSQNSGTEISSRVPTKANVGGVSFIFHHDRKGGEAYVMLKAKN